MRLENPYDFMVEDSEKASKKYYGNFDDPCLSNYDTLLQNVHDQKTRKQVEFTLILSNGFKGPCKLFEEVGGRKKTSRYQHFVINDNNRDQRNKDSKKTSIATVVEINTEANVAKKASALVAATDHGEKYPKVSVATIGKLQENTRALCKMAAKSFRSKRDIQTRQTIGCGIKQGKLYYLDLQSKDSNKLQQALMADGSEGEKKKYEIWLWHRRLGYASFGYLKKLFPSLFAKSDISGFRCDICELAKSHHGPSKVSTLSGSRWFVTFIDDCTRMTWLCSMKTKDEVNLLFQKFHKMIETQYNAKVRVLRSDNGGEYQSFYLQKYLEGHGIIHQTTCSNTPQ
uniref:Integrase catalytic domain-containing protein n=1 Tax=Vitis vinifera TaxID=29760 RepID=A5BLL5_VITVI|nr:hypothetical protein VITISV_028698 [Vitis vinifera]